MKKLTSLSAVAALAVLASQAPVFGLTLTDLGTTMTGDYTYGQSDSKGAGTPPSNSTDGKSTPAGQTFSLSSLGVSGYDTALELTDVYVKGNAKADASGTTDWTLTIGTVSAGTFSLLDSETVDNVAAGAKDYLQFTLSDYVTLNADTEYAFFVSTSNKYAIDGTNNPSYSTDLSGGSASISGSAVTEDDTKSRTFFLNTVPVPEPANWALIPVLGTAAFFGFRRFRSSTVA